MLCRSEFAHTTPNAGLSPWASSLLAKISCLTAEQPAVNTSQITTQTTHTHTHNSARMITLTNLQATIVSKIICFQLHSLLI